MLVSLLDPCYANFLILSLYLLLVSSRYPDSDLLALSAGGNARTRKAQRRSEHNVKIAKSTGGSWHQAALVSACAGRRYRYMLWRVQGGRGARCMMRWSGGGTESERCQFRLAAVRNPGLVALARGFR